MALATLTAEFQKKNMRLAFVDKVKVRFRAFIVDHGARPRSDVEAKNVAKNLRKMGKHHVVGLVIDCSDHHVRFFLLLVIQKTYSIMLS